jgi:tetratricopeptide (TPR) repeat protein
MPQTGGHSGIPPEAPPNVSDEINAAGGLTPQELHRFLQAGPVDPQDFLFSGEPLPPSALLNQLRVEVRDTAPPPATPSIEMRVELEEAVTPSLILEETLAPSSIPIGRECRLSQSVMFEIQARYYEKAGLEAWKSIPFYLSSSAHVAEHYAALILAFIDDYRPHLNPDEPVYILELATGAGRLSYLLLRELLRKQAYFERYRGLSLKYVMTDFTEATAKFWEAHEKFKPYIESGLLDFAVFNPLTDTSLILRGSGRILSPDGIRNPVIAIGNYFFDTIPHDVFRVQSKHLYEGLVNVRRRVKSGQPLPDTDELPPIEDVETFYQYRELPDEHYYDDARLNAILRFYRENIDVGNVMFPVGAFGVLRNLQTLSSNRLVLLSSDKAHVNYGLMSRMPPAYAIHDGTFSYMVNYDAIGRYFEQDGGLCLKTHSDNWSLQTVCCVETAPPDCRFENLRYVFNERLQRMGAINTLCSLLPDLKRESVEDQIDYYLCHIRINLADPKLIGCVVNELSPLLPAICHWQRAELLELMDEAWENYYHFPGETNLPFYLCQLYFMLDMHEQSLSRLDDTIRHHGEHEILYFLKGQNHEALGRYEEARQMYRRALALNPDFPDLQASLDRIAAL